MIRKILRPLALILVFTAIFPLLVGCGENNQSVLSYDGIKIDQTAYEYWYIQLKDYYVDSYSDIVDEIPLWNSKMPDSDVTYGEYIDTKIRTQIEYYLAGNILFEQYDLDLSDTVIQNIDTDIDDGINSFGSRAEYDAYLEARYGVNSRELRKIKIMEQKFLAVYTHLYDPENGIEKASDSEIADFYTNNYVRIKYYMVLKNYDYVYDKDGNRVVENNAYKTVELDEAGKLENQKQATEVYEAIKNGKNIDEYLKKDFGDLAKKFPNGYYVLNNDNYVAAFTSTIIKPAFELEINEVALCENEDAYFIVQRLGLIDKAYLGSDKAQFESIGSDAVEKKFIEKFEEIMKTIERNNDLINQYSVITVR